MNSVRDHLQLRIPKVLGLVIVLLVCGCQKQAVEADGSIEGQMGKEGSFLAYEHTVVLSVGPEEVSRRMVSVREACTGQRFGSCSVLTFEEASGAYPSGTIVARLVPEAVKPLIAFGSEGATTSSSSTRAEDVSGAVGDVEREREQLRAQSELLRELQSRSDLTASDLISLSSELAKINVRQAELEGTAATLSHRIETNLLTIRYSSVAEVSAWKRITSAVTESGESFGDGVVEAVGLIAFGIPFLAIAFPLALLWRWAWRKTTGKGSRAGSRE
jgi:hypothetical protein